MRQFYWPFGVILALATVAPLNGQPCCPAASGGGRIAFVKQGISVNQIFLMDVNASGMGATPIRLTTDAEPENYPSWSPDGTHLVYQRD